MAAVVFESDEYRIVDRHDTQAEFAIEAAGKDALGVLKWDFLRVLRQNEGAASVDRILFDVLKNFPKAVSRGLREDKA